MTWVWTVSAVLLTAASFFIAGTNLVWQPSIPVALIVLIGVALSLGDDALGIRLGFSALRGDLTAWRVCRPFSVIETTSPGCTSSVETRWSHSSSLPASAHISVEQTWRWYLPVGTVWYVE